MSLTPAQHRLLTYLAGHLRATGVCPSIDEMMAALGSRARGHVHGMVGVLEERGYVHRLSHGRARCIEILRLPDDLSDRWLGTVSTGAIVRELIGRGAGPPTGPDEGPCPLCAARRPDMAAVIELSDAAATAANGHGPPPGTTEAVRAAARLRRSAAAARAGATPGGRRPMP